MIFLEEIIVGVGGVASISFPFGGGSISQAYRHLYLVWTARCSNAAAQIVSVQLNADSGTNYERQEEFVANATLSGAGITGATSDRVGGIPGSGDLANSWGSGDILFPYYSATVAFKNFLSRNMRTTAATAGGQIEEIHGHTWKNTGAITAILMLPGANNFIQNSRFSLYGIT